MKTILTFNLDPHFRSQISHLVVFSPRSWHPDSFKKFFPDSFVSGKKSSFTRFLFSSFSISSSFNFNRSFQKTQFILDLLILLKFHEAGAEEKKSHLMNYHLKNSFDSTKYCLSENMMIINKKEANLVESDISQNSTMTNVVHINFKMSSALPFLT